MSRLFPAARPVTGANAAAMKYDILSAIGLIGVHGSAREQVSMPRLALLVTARYNWRRSEVSMGQAEMARLWGVSERTAKREVKFWVERQLLVCSKPGVRGRVASYRLNLSRVMELSEPFWAAIGSDFVDRMRVDTASASPDQKVVHLPIKRKTDHAADPADPWGGVKHALRTGHPEVYSSWLSELVFEQEGPGAVRVTAPSRFIASYVEGHYMDILFAAARDALPELRHITLCAK